MKRPQYRRPADSDLPVIPNHNDPSLHARTGIWCKHCNTRLILISGELVHQRDNMFSCYRRDTIAEASETEPPPRGFGHSRHNL